MSESSKSVKISYVVFLVMVVITVAFFFVARKGRDSNFSFDDESIYDWSDDWNVSFGTTAGVVKNLPLFIEAERGRAVVIKKTLPRKIKKYNCLMIESKRQEVLVHVGGILRFSYTNTEKQSVSNTPASSIILVPVYSTDAGQDVSILISSDSYHSGDLSRIYLGNEVSILLMLIKNNIIWVFLGVIIFIIGVGSLLGYVTYGKSFDEGGTLVFMFWYGLLASVWCLTQSGIRQIFVGDIALFENLGYCFYMLIPMPLLFYANRVFKDKYKIAVVVLSIITFANYILENVFQTSTSLDFFEMRIGTNILILLVCCFIMVPCIQDIKMTKSGNHNGIYGLIGILAIAAGLIVEITEIILKTEHTGNFFALGSLVYLATNVIHTAVRFSREQQLKKNAESASRAKSKFLATMSHEIRTPINAVLGMNEMILRDSKENNIREYAANISDAGRSLLSLVNDILDFSKIESGKMDIICVEYPLKNLLRDLILMIEGRVSKKGLNLILEIDESIPSIYYGDEVRLKQVITNLLTNAAKYTDSGDITFTVGCNSINEKEVELYVSVKDTGIGIRKEDVEKLTDSFVRVDETRNRNIEGTGLGLAITTQILELMGSKLELESEYGKGSNFFFTLKQKVIDASPMGYVMSHEEKEIKRNSISFCAPEARVLAVDDNPMNLVVVKGLLRPSKIQIETCESGQECLELCSKYYYDVILMDHMMPEMDGIETLKRLREDLNSPCCDTKIIALTANAISGAADMYRENGFDGYLTKPIELSELDTCLRNFIPKEIVLPFTESVEEALAAEETQADDRLSTPADTDNSQEALSTDLIDGKVAMNYCGDDYKSYVEIVKSYYKYGIKKIAPPEDESGRVFGDLPLKEFIVMIHALKSSSRTIGAVSLADMAASLEQAGIQEDLDYISANEAECKKTYAVVLEQLRVYMEARGIIAPMENVDMKTSTASMETSQQADSKALSADVRNVLEQVRDALDDFDYDIAMELVEGILENK